MSALAIIDMLCFFYDFYEFSIFPQNARIDQIENAGGVRRHVASICDGSLTPKSTFSKIDFDPNSDDVVQASWQGPFFSEITRPWNLGSVLARICGYINPEIEY